MPEAWLPCRAKCVEWPMKKSGAQRWLLLISHSAVSDSLWSHRLQHARLPCPSPSSGACSNSRPLRQWCHPTISSSAIPFSPCLQSFPASGSFPVSWLFSSGDQCIGASESVLQINIQGLFPLGLTSLIFLLSKELFKHLLQHHSSKASQTEREKSPVIQLSPALSQPACWMKCDFSCRASRTTQLSPFQITELWATKKCFLCFAPKF